MIHSIRYNTVVLSIFYNKDTKIGSQPREQPITLQQIKEAQHKASQGVQD